MKFRDWCRTHWFHLALMGIALLPLIAFGKSLVQDFAAIDDSFLIVDNPIVHGLDGQRIRLAFTTFDPELYIPLTLLSFQLDWVLGGGSPLPFHITNIILHSINALLVAWLFLQWTHSRVTALFVGAVFAIHPLHAEAVVWAAGRKDLLSTMFFLLSLLFYLKHQERKSEARSTKSEGNSNIQYSNFKFPSSFGFRISNFYLLSLAFFLLALLSKALAATLPAILLLQLILIEDRGTLRRRIPSIIPFFFLSLFFLWVATFGKEHILASSTFLETVAMAQKSALFYIQKFFIPSGLTVIYPFQGTLSILRAEFLLPALVHAALITLALWQARKRPLFSVGILFYYSTLSPTFFNFHKGDLLFFAVDRYAYIPSIGLFLSASVIVRDLLRALNPPMTFRQICAAVILTALMIVSIRQTGFWATPDTLFGRSIALYPDSVSARMAMASVLRQRHQLEEAFELVHTGARFSEHPGLNVEAGLIYSSAGQVPDAREQFHLALKKNPKLPPPMFYLGFLDEYEGNARSAIEWYRKAALEDPSYVTARVHLANLLMERDELKEASQQLDEALKWNPVSAEAIAAKIALEELKENADEVASWRSWQKHMLGESS